MPSKPKASGEVVLFIGLALAVVAGREWWRVSHRLDVPMLSVEALVALAPFFVIGAIVICSALLYWLIRDKNDGS